ncbi:MAG: hypothetical protein MZV70_02595 [Desulfobacterales bacterium]|nr:hypothetical protein [Desulfobacterales bacterium]
MMAKGGFESLRPYVSPRKPEEGSFRLTFGRTAVHTHAQSQNNPILNEIIPENTLWINDSEAAKLGIKDGDTVEVKRRRVCGEDKSEGDTVHSPRSRLHAPWFRQRHPPGTTLLREGLPGDEASRSDSSRRSIPWAAVSHTSKAW